MTKLHCVAALALLLTGCTLRLHQSKDLNTRTSEGCSFSSVDLSKAIDIPEDNRNLTAITKGKIPADNKGKTEYIYDLIQNHWRKKFDEKTDTLGHKPNSVQLISKFVKLLGCPNEEALKAEFEQGRYRDIRLYTDESEDPFGYKREKIPNYVIMNKALRTYGSMAEISSKAPKAADLISKLDKALAIMPSVMGLVFRGTSLENALLAKIIREGEMIDAGFVSTSLDITDGFDFLNKTSNTATHSRVFMIIYGTGGKFLPYGQFSKEEEVLFPHGTKFKVNHSFKYDNPDAGNDSMRTTTFLFMEESKL